MRRLLLPVLPVACTLGLLSACGGMVSAEPDPTLEDGGEVGPDAIRPDTRTDSYRRDSSDSHADAGDVERDTWVDPGCPDTPAPPTEYKCDPMVVTSCGAGMSCYPFVTYPTEPCEHERYGSMCVKAGAGKQGDPCGGGGGGGADCAAGFVCVVSGAGNQCVQLCKSGTPGGCPEGLVCSPLDVPGLGGCL